MLNSLSLTERIQMIRSGGICIRIGPFVFSLHTSILELAEPVCYLYEGHETLTSPEFVDFNVTLKPRGGLRKYVSPEATMENDGITLFQRFPRRHALAYWEWGLNRCIVRHCSNYLILHSAVVERAGRALVLVGEPGSGKSTLCAALASSGWRLLSDELGLLRPSDGEFIGVARPITLKNESIPAIQNLTPHIGLAPVVKDTIKGDIRHIRPDPNWAARADHTASPAWLVFVRYEEGAGLQVREVNKAQAMIRIAGMAFNYGILGLRGFEALGDAVDKSETLSLRYDDLEQAIKFFTSPPFSSGAAQQETGKGQSE